MTLESPSLFADLEMESKSESSLGEAAATLKLPRTRRFRRTSGEATAEPFDRRSPDWRLLATSILLFITVALGSLFVRGALLDATYGSLMWEDHRVVAGESLTSIIAERDLPDVGIGRIVTWVEERNGLSSADIVPGQVLSVPR